MSDIEILSENPLCDAGDCGRKGKAVVDDITYDPNDPIDLVKRYNCNFIEVDGVPQACPDILEWARWFEEADRVVERHYFGTEDEVMVSSVFLAIDHNYFGTEPVLYETMVFGFPVEMMTRYTNREDCVRGHYAVLRFVAGVMYLKDKGARWRRVKQFIRRSAHWGLIEDDYNFQREFRRWFK